MKKLKLDLDQIQVFSFQVETPGSSSGTVKAFSADSDIGCSAIGCISHHCTGDSCGSDCPREHITYFC
jgi:hypothetical protein